ncbi:MAG TPA: hypothetical protein VF316_08500, partial [Polyangiaceae bacterium]
MRRKAPLLAVLAVLAAVGGYLAYSRLESKPAGPVPQGVPTASPPTMHAADVPVTLVASSLPLAATDGAPRVMPFGDGADALGRGTTPDGHPIAPASFLADGNELLVLDQEKSRLLRSDGSSIPLPGKRADDVARGADGSLAVLDRLGSKDVAMLDANGRVRGRLPLEGTGIDDPRDVTRVVVSGKDVLVERNGGGPLLLIGGVDGVPAKERTEIPGMPTRDGSSLVSAGVTSEEEGRAWVTLADRLGVHRWTRELRFPAQLSGVAFLDSDTGPTRTIWTVMLGGSSSADYVNWAICLDAASGAVRGSFSLTVENPPWESFRDFAVK